MEDLSMFDLQPGENVGGYTLLDRLGGGAMGSVWKVQDDGGQLYAMKILRASMQRNTNGSSSSEDDEQNKARIRLRREALSLQKIHNPGVCGIVDMELDASIAFIVTELIYGHDLREDVEENGPYIADDLERLAHKLIDAVRAVHKAGIIHRDIKPTNVMISMTGPVLVDFGIAMGEGESHVTRTGLVMGTPGFIAPEIIEGGDSDDVTDWWSVAAVLAFAATGKPVFGTKPMMAVLERAASGNADLRGLPPRTMEAFRSALNPDRSKRCAPEELEKAISEDALNPESWPEANHPFVRETARETARTVCETKHETPLENLEIRSQKKEPAQKIPNNPRKLWPESQKNDETIKLNHKISNYITSNNAPTGTKLLPASATFEIIPSEENSTTLLKETMPKYDTSTANRQESNTPIAAESSIEQNQNVIPPSFENHRNSENKENRESSESNENAQEEQNNSADPHIYTRRGTWVAIPCIFVISSIAELSVIDSYSANIIFMLITATAGFNTSAQLHRIQSNDGIFSRNLLIRIGSLPWHFIKAIIYTLPRLLGIILCGMICAAAYPFITGTSPQLLTIPLWNFSVQLPAYSPDVFSPTSAGYAIGILIGWLITSISGNTKIFRLGLGALCGAGKV